MITTKSFRVAATIVAAVLLSACSGKSRKSVSEDGVLLLYHINKEHFLPSVTK